MIRAFCLFLALHAAAFAVEPGERLPDPALESRARAISAELRCVVCQNESIDESRAELAQDIRRLVRERLLAGETNDAVTRAVVDRYGAFVLLRPPVISATMLLWFGPGLLLVGAAATVGVWLRRRPASVPAPLTEAEQARLDTLTREDRS